MNEVLQTLRNRRSVRKFTPEQVDGAALEAIVEAGRYAPSGTNSQLARLLVIQRPEALEKLVRTVREQLSAMDEHSEGYALLSNAVRLSRKGTYVFHYGAPTLVVVANRRDYPNAMADSACVMENMMIAAASLDVGACWINQLHWLDGNRAVRAALEELGLREEETVCASLSLGYAAVKPEGVLERRGNQVVWVR